MNLRPPLLGIGLVVAAASACAHDKPVDKRTRVASPQEDTRARDAHAQVAARAQEARAWLNGFPVCEGPIDAPDVDSLRKKVDSDPLTVTVRGLMTLESSETCSLMECMGSACCNGCLIQWALVAPRTTDGQQSGQLAIRDNRTMDTFGISAQDCTVEEVRRQFPSAEVVITGEIWKDGVHDVIIPTSICRVPSPAQ
jgi:hypothetical protein